MRDFPINVINKKILNLNTFIFLNVLKFCFQTSEGTLKFFTLSQSEGLKDQIAIGKLINFWSLEDGKYLNCLFLSDHLNILKKLKDLVVT